MTSRVKRLTFIPIPEKLSFFCPSCSESDIVWNRQTNQLNCQSCSHQYPGPPCKYCGSKDIKPHQLIFGRWRCKKCNRTYIPPRNSSNAKSDYSKKVSKHVSFIDYEDILNEDEEFVCQQYNMRPRISKVYKDHVCSSDDDSFEDDNDSFEEIDNLENWDDESSASPPPHPIQNSKNSPIGNLKFKDILNMSTIMNRSKIDDEELNILQNDNILFDSALIDNMIETKNVDLRESILSALDNVIVQLSCPVIDNWNEKSARCWLKAHRFRLKNDFSISLSKLLEVCIEDTPLVLASCQVLALSSLDRRNIDDILSSFGIIKICNLIKCIIHQKVEKPEQILTYLIFTILSIVSCDIGEIDLDDSDVSDSVKFLASTIYTFDKIAEIQTIGVRLLFVFLSIPKGRELLSVDETASFLSRIIEYGTLGVNVNETFGFKFFDDDLACIENFQSIDKETREYSCACIYRIFSCNKTVLKCVNIGILSDFLHNILMSSIHKTIRLDILYDNICLFSEIMGLSEDHYIDLGTRKDLISHLISLMDIYTSHPTILISICKNLILLIPSSYKEIQYEETNIIVDFATQQGLAKRLKMAMSAYKKNVEIQIMCFALLTFRLKTCKPVLSKKITDSIYKYKREERL